MSFDFNAISSSLSDANQKTEGTGVSFAGKSLKLNTEEDAKEVTDKIEKCKNMEYLDLEGNTLGPDAAKGISKAIEKHGSNLKRALWKDMFTGRMKDEIPVALEHLGRGLNLAGTQLVELDLSDNAFGPIGVKGLAALLSSSSCYTLQALRLNNNGLGITGGKMLAKALLDCHANSIKDTNKPLALKTFIAGRNRLENDGAKALSEVFKKLTSLEEVVMPQNGIYHIGISALADGLSTNQGLRILNLNDNTVGPKGAQALADILYNFSCLERLNLGDCLLKTRGAAVLADALAIKGNHPSLTELNLSFNEIKYRGAGSIAKAMADKTQLTTLALNGNAFGEQGRSELIESLKGSDRIESLDALDEDEDDEEESEEEDEESEADETKSLDDEDELNESNESITVLKPAENVNKVVTILEFMSAPTGENFLLLQGDKAQVFLDHIRNISKLENEDLTNDVMKVIMKVSALCSSGYVDVRVPAEQVTERLYSELFAIAQNGEQLPSLNDALLVHLGLLKGEEKMKIDWNLEGCFKALEKVCQRDYFLAQTRDSLKAFLDMPMKPSRTRVIDPFQEAKSLLKASLERTQST